MFKSTDFGNSWSSLGGPGAGNLNNIAVAWNNTDRMYISKGGSMWTTSDGGGNWTSISGLPDAYITDIQIDPATAERVFVSVSSYLGEKVFVSTDAGGSWTAMSNGLPSVPVHCLAYNIGTTDEIYAGTDIGVYAWNGIGWEDFNIGLPNVEVFDLEIQETQNTLYAGTYGRGLWKASIGPEEGCTDPASCNYNPTAIIDNGSCTTNSTSAASAAVTTAVAVGAPSTLPATTTAQATIDDGTCVLEYPQSVVVTITTDNYPGETTWTITDADGQPDAQRRTLIPTRERGTANRPTSARAATPLPSTTATATASAAGLATAASTSPQEGPPCSRAGSFCLLHLRHVLLGPRPPGHSRLHRPRRRQLRPRRHHRRRQLHGRLCTGDFNGNGIIEVSDVLVTLERVWVPLPVSWPTSMATASSASPTCSSCSGQFGDPCP